MKVVVEENIKKDKYILQLGDLVESGYEDTLYVAAQQWWEEEGKYGYILWSLEGDQGYSGYHDTLEQLTDSLVDGERIFKASEYELRLVRKGE